LLLYYNNTGKEVIIMKRFSRASVALFVAAALAHTAALADPQATNPQATKNSSSTEPLTEVVVTGSRIKRVLTEGATPITILTSNRTRDLNDAVKRRCLYQWLDYPERERELAIVQSQVPQASQLLTEAVTQFVSRLRSLPFANAFQRSPGISESVEWAKALVALDTLQLDPEVIQDTAGILFKQREDVAALMPMIDELLRPEPDLA
jgi:hypothetical protein